MKLTKFQKIFLIVSSCFLLSACMVSKNPLSDLKNATFDARLKGLWKYCENDKECGYLHIGKDKDNKTIFHFVCYEKDDELEYSSTTMFPTTIDGNSFMNIMMEQKEQNCEGYYFARYGFTDKNTFFWALMSQKKT